MTERELPLLPDDGIHDEPENQLFITEKAMVDTALDMIAALALRGDQSTYKDPQWEADAVSLLAGVDYLTQLAEATSKDNGYVFTTDNHGWERNVQAPSASNVTGPYVEISAGTPHREHSYGMTLIFRRYDEWRSEHEVVMGRGKDGGHETEMVKFRKSGDVWHIDAVSHYPTSSYLTVKANLYDTGLQTKVIPKIKA